MKWQRIKKSSDASLAGVLVQIEEVDRSVKAVTLTDAKGNQVKIALDSYSMNVLVPAEPTMKDAFRLHGIYKGLQVREHFAYEHEAEARHRELSNVETLSVEKVKIAVDDDGKTPDGDEIPF